MAAHGLGKLYSMRARGAICTEPLPSLESVILSYNGVRDIPAALLHCWAHAITLDLSHNRIEQLPASVAALAGADTLQLYVPLAIRCLYNSHCSVSTVYFICSCQAIPMTC
jgi:Leucine-rich repeat (LRR) protein